MKRIVIAIFFLLVCPKLVLAGRPLSTDDAGTVERGHLELEYGYQYVNAADNEYNWSSCIKYGLGQRWDLGVEIPYQYLEVSSGDDADGLNDIILSSKYRFFEESENRPALALSFSIKTDSGNDDKGLGTGAKDYAVNAIFSKQLETVGSHVNLGYTYVGAPEGEKHDDLFSYALALEYRLSDRLNLVGELAGETNFDGDFDDNAFSGLTGFNYAFSDIATFDFGAGLGISEASSDYSLTCGLTLSF